MSAPSPILTRVRGLIHGVLIEGNLPLEFRDLLIDVEPGTEPRTGKLKVLFKESNDIPDIPAFWRGTSRDGRSTFSMAGTTDSLTLRVRCQGDGLFQIEADTIRIHWQPGGTGAAHYFATYGLPLWLELQGHTVLHGSSVGSGSSAVGWLADSGTGKSTLCARLIDQGFDFVSDDTLVINRNKDDVVTACMGAPVIRLWPSALQAAPGFGNFQNRLVHDNFLKRQYRLPQALLCHSSKQVFLKAIVELNRSRDSTCPTSLCRMETKQGLMLMIKHSLLAAPLDSILDQGERLMRLARIAENLDFFQLTLAAGERDEATWVNKVFQALR